LNEEGKKRESVAVERELGKMGRRGGGGRSGGGRSGGGGGLFGKKAPAKPKAAPQQQQQRREQQQQAPPPPAAAPAQAAPPAVQGGGGGMMSGFGGMVAQGMALGVGSSIGHRAVDGAMGMFSGGSSSDEAQPSQTAPQPIPQQQQALGNVNEVCAIDQKELMQCLQENAQNAAACDYYFQALRACQENAQYQ